MQKTILLPGVLLCLSCFCTLLANAQDTLRQSDRFSPPAHFFSTLEKKTTFLHQKISHKSDRYMRKIRNSEARLEALVSKKDSLLAHRLFAGIQDRYTLLTGAETHAPTNIYIGYIDSLTTALGFLRERNINTEGCSQLIQGLNTFQKDLQNADQMRKFLLNRQQYLKEQLTGLVIPSRLRAFKKQVYYYQAQVAEYKALLGDHNRLERAVLTRISYMPEFRAFFEAHSELGSLFGMGARGADSIKASFTGLQTRASVQQQISALPVNEPQRFLQKTVDDANARLVTAKQLDRLPQLSKLKDAFGFKPNTQKVKPFKERLEKGINIHFDQVSNFYPQRADVGFSVGYRLTDRGSIGIGASCKLGLGSSLGDAKLSSEGYSVRTYADYKIKGNFYLHGGYERLYAAQPKLSETGRWQNSGLIGLDKKYKISKKLQGEMQLLFDFLSYGAYPRREPVVFRVGYSF